MPATIAIKENFPVLEMTCAACAVSVESMLKSVPGVDDAGVNFANQTAWVQYHPDKAPRTALQQAVRSIGYDLIIDLDNSAELQENARLKSLQSLRRRTIWASALSLPVMILAMFFMDLPYVNWIMMLLSAPVVFYFGGDFFVHAWKQARRGRANMDTLVALSTGVAFLFSAFNTIFADYWHQRGIHPHVYFEAAAVIVAFISLGKLLEERATSNASSALKKLMGLQPQSVLLLLPDGASQQIAISQVKPGDTLLVRPGEKIPVDGTLTGGESYVDESMISGEPVAVLKSAGKPVFAGTLNQKGSFQFRADKVGSDTLLAQIIRRVQEAQGSKAPVQKLVDKIAGIFVPIVMGIALLTFVIWLVSGVDNAFTYALLTAVTVLVIACPCALGLATPTAIMVGVGKGAENNILIKDAESFERARQVNVIVMDKTGTITEGKPTVSLLALFDKDREAALKQVLLAIEAQSEHPLAQAVVAHLQGEGVSLLQPEKMQSVTGKGVLATLNGKEYAVGNQRLMQDLQVKLPTAAEAQVRLLQEQAKTVVLFSEAGTLAGILAIEDKLKPGSAAAVQKLKDMGMELYMLTGDNQQTAAAVAAEAGVPNYRAELLPADKSAFIRELQQQGKVVAMAGDGINDSEALAQADLGIAMGAGSDIAMDVAKMTLTGSDLNAIPKALRLSRLTVNTIRQNLFWAFIYNLVGVPLAAGVLYPVNGFLLDPMIAGAAMALSSVSVVTNSLLLKWKKI